MARTSTKGPAKRGAKKKKRATIKDGIVHVHATFNNTVITVTDIQGNTLGQSSAGRLGFKGARKSTPYAAQKAAVDAGSQARVYGMENVEISFHGPGPCREYVVKALKGHEVQFNITALRDDTPIPHNGCRPRKKRRV